MIGSALYDRETHHGSRRLCGDRQEYPRNGSHTYNCQHCLSGSKLRSASLPSGAVDDVQPRRSGDVSPSPTTINVSCGRSNRNYCTVFWEIKGSISDTRRKGKETGDSDQDDSLNRSRLQLRGDSSLLSTRSLALSSSRTRTRRSEAAGGTSGIGTIPWPCSPSDSTTVRVSSAWLMAQGSGSKDATISADTKALQDLKRWRGGTQSSADESGIRTHVRRLRRCTP